MRRRLVLAAALLSVAASRVRPASQDAAREASALATLVEEGQVVFGAECVTCHAADGGEDMGPALSGSPSMANGDVVVTRVLAGVKDMPGFAVTLTDRQIAAVSTYVRNAWENKHGVVLEADVKRLRDALPKPR